MISKFNNFNRMNESTRQLPAWQEQAIQELIDSILEHISEFGYDNISDLEKEIMMKASTDRQSLVDYIESDDNEVLSFDKLGHILINGVPYEQYQIDKKSGKFDKDKKGKKDTTKWGDTSKHQKTIPHPPYKIRVYKNNGSPIRSYYIFWVEGEHEGAKKKFISISKDIKKDPFGSLLGIGWKNDTMKEVHGYLDDDYDKFRDLTPSELNEFETFLALRKSFRKGEFVVVKDNPKETKENLKMLKALKRLYKKIANA